MAIKQMLHTPEGVRDIYGTEFSKKRTLLNSIESTFNAFGYNGIQTPVLEFFDIFKKERGSVVSKEMFKLFDSENNTLVLRPDMTPSIVRAISKYYEPKDLPVRVFYSGDTFINDRSYRLRLKECCDAGIELFGDDSVEADAEVIACMIESLKSCGLKEFQISIGSAAFLNGLFAEIGFSEETEAQVRTYLMNKNLFVLETLLRKENLTDRQLEVFARLQNYAGTIDQVLDMDRLVRNEMSKTALKRLRDIYRTLGYYDLQKYVSFDLSVVTGFQYYTGIIFNAYTYGTGNAIVSGGRYDTLMSQFSYEAAAIGFKISIDGLMTALSRQNIEVEAPLSDSLFLMGRDQEEACIRLVTRLRTSGRRVAIRLLDDDKKLEHFFEYAKNNGFKTIYYMNRSSSNITVADPVSETKRTLELADFEGEVF